MQSLDLLERIRLDDHSWVDVGRDMVYGSDELFAAIHDQLPWRALTRPMYDRIVNVPRLTTVLAVDDLRLPPIVQSIAGALSLRYGREFDHVGANLYRSGDDSVAWHSDRVRLRVPDPVIAIVSLGGSRVFRLRPRGGGPGRSIPLHSGDLLTMGGACQHRWEHCIPKVSRAQPRISITIRHDYERGAEGPDWTVSV